MPIEGISQPDILMVSEDIRLRRYDGNCAVALPWYQEADTVFLLDGKREPYDMKRLEKMYRYLDSRGELYWIEVSEDMGFRPIGDVTFCPHDMPIVIGEKKHRGKGIGRRVIRALAERGKSLGYTTLYIDEIYKYNIASQKAFEGAGFVRYEETERGCRYRLTGTK